MLRAGAKRPHAELVDVGRTERRGSLNRLELLRHPTDRSSTSRLPNPPPRLARPRGHLSFTGQPRRRAEIFFFGERAERCSLQAHPQRSEDSSLRGGPRVKEGCSDAHCRPEGDWEIWMRRERSASMNGAVPTVVACSQNLPRKSRDEPKNIPARGVKHLADVGAAPGD